MNIAKIIATELNSAINQVEAAITLLDEGNTVPFISRYRKEVTGGLTDTQLRQLEERLIYLRELEERRQTILKSIRDQDKLTPDLEKDILDADNKARLEDLYLPYKPKRHTKAQIAREAGLGPLAEKLLAQPELNPETVAAEFINPEKNIADVASALTGARHILLEQFAEDAELVGQLREYLWDNALLVSELMTGKEQVGAKFADYFAFNQALKKIPSHRALAMFRGQREAVLRIFLAFPDEINQETGALNNQLTATADQSVTKNSAACTHSQLCINKIAQRFNISKQGRAGDNWLQDTVTLTWKTKLLIKLELELLTQLREQAEVDAIKVFAHNLKDLIMAAPAGQRVTMGLDPGLRTGVKVAIIDKTGDLLIHTTIFPHAPQKQWDASLDMLAKLCRQFHVELVSIGNGTASRETDKLVIELMQKHPELKLTKIVVSEAGASVYSASALAAAEFPDLDVSFRGAVSIARRLQDPLAELVKIEPKAIGVGQYQHDVSQLQLAKNLDSVVEDCVNSVGVNLNTASAALLARVAGLNKTLASNIVQFRQQKGAFSDRAALKEVPRLGGKCFEQAAGFLRIINGNNPLDGSAVHPEAYPIIEKILKKHQVTIKDIIGNSEFLHRLNPADFVDEHFGLPTITDIIKELEKPGLDPRPEFKTATFKEGVATLNDLKEGMILEGVVTNITDFGAFVDIGVHQDGLVHKSAMSQQFIKDPRDVVKIGTIVSVKVVEVDIERKRINLTMRLSDEKSESNLINFTRPANERTNRNGERKTSDKKPVLTNGTGEKSTQFSRAHSNTPHSKSGFSQKSSNSFNNKTDGLKQSFKQKSQTKNFSQKPAQANMPSAFAEALANALKK